MGYMLSINLILLFIFILWFLISLRWERDWIASLDRKEYKLYFLYAMSDLLLRKTGLQRLLYRKEKVTESIKALNATNKPDNLRRIYWCNKISLIIMILFLFNLLSLFGQLQTGDLSKLHQDRFLSRPDYGEGSDEVELNVTMEQKDKQGAAVKDSYSEDVRVKVNERIYKEADRIKLFEKAFRYLDKVVLGKNESFENIDKNLNFPGKIPGMSILVTWLPQDYNLIHGDGTISNEDVSADGVVTNVTAKLSYYGDEMEYKKTFRIMPKQYTTEELLHKQLEAEMVNAAEKTKEDTSLELPVTIDNYRLNWKERRRNTGNTLFFIGIAAALIVWFYNERELEEKMKKRKEQMLLDYPEITNKFTLLVGAGMTVKQAWSKIAYDYEAKLAVGQMKKRFAYEEMLLTAHELKLGISESDAYEQFGRRAGLLPFLKFSSLIVQNLKKGNRGLSELLNLEATEAFEERKEIAKRLGEEAGTKLLVPMMIMLVIVFIIILVPAFRSFAI